MFGILNSFLSLFSRIRTEYVGLLYKSLYSVFVRENIDQKTLHIWMLHAAMAFTVWKT